MEPSHIDFATIKRNSIPSTHNNATTAEIQLRPFSDSPNARSKTITTADGFDTFGVCHRVLLTLKHTLNPCFQVLNRHAAQNHAYQVGVSEDRGTRRTMEDAHSFVVDFARVRGQGFFAVFDGHAGKHAAEWCGAHFHEVRYAF
jgi:protein phosphatase PTC1